MIARILSITLLLMLPFATTVVMADSAPPTSSPSEGAALIGPALRATDLERSTKFYTDGLGMVVGTTLKHGPVTEVHFGFVGSVKGPGILLYRDETAGKSPPIDHGNGFGRIILQVPDVAMLSARLVTAGYATGELHAAGPYKVLNVTDPDGYAYEIVQLPAPQAQK